MKAKGLLDVSLGKVPLLEVDGAQTLGRRGQRWHHGLELGGEVELQWLFGSICCFQLVILRDSLHIFKIKHFQ